MDPKKLIADIEEFGWTIIALEATDYLPSFAYTVGLWKNFQHPEIIAFGLPVGMMHTILNQAGDIVKGGTQIEAHKVYDDFFENGKACFLEVDELNISDYITYASELNGEKSFPVIQFIWTDRNLKFPWEDKFEEEFIFKQPLLDRNASFKFYEPKDLIVISAKVEGEPIIKVIHEANGNWVFFSKTVNTFVEQSTLGEMIEEDHSLNDLFDLDYGQYAERKSVGEKWERKLLS